MSGYTVMHPSKIKEIESMYEFKFLSSRRLDNEDLIGYRFRLKIESRVKIGMRKGYKYNLNGDRYYCISDLIKFMMNYEGND